MSSPNPIQWIRLDIKKASNVAKEVDDVLKLYTSTIELGDRKKIHALQKTIEDRIYELEDFETAHDDDERHVLFDKQRLRLRRALQQYRDIELDHNNNNNNRGGKETPKNTGTDLYNTLMRNDIQNNNNQYTTEEMEENVDEVCIVDSLAKNKNRTSSSPASLTKEKASIKKVSFSSASNNNKKNSNINTSNQTTKSSIESGKNNEEKATISQPWVPAGNLERNKKGKTFKVQESNTEIKPIYQWEKVPNSSKASAKGSSKATNFSSKKDGINQMQILDSSSSNDEEGTELNKAVTCEGVKYFASSKNGYYDPPSAFFQSEKGQSSEHHSAASNSFSTLDFAIILNEAEYNVVLSRKRALAKKDIKHESTLNLDSPYVDKWRVDEVIYRPSSSSDKWVDPRGFNITPQL